MCPPGLDDGKDDDGLLRSESERARSEEISFSATEDCSAANKETFLLFFVENSSIFEMTYNVEKISKKNVRLQIN